MKFLQKVNDRIVHFTTKCCLNSQEEKASFVFISGFISVHICVVIIKYADLKSTEL